MAYPEWPPERLDTSIVHIGPGAVCQSIGLCSSTRQPPAQVATRIPSGPASRFNWVCAWSWLMSSASTPYSPVSSCTAKTHSSAGCVRVSSVRTASISATAMPSSAPVSCHLHAGCRRSPQARWDRTQSHAAHLGTLPHHVHLSLHHKGRSSFAAWRGSLFDDQIVHCVARDGAAVRLTDCLHIFRSSLFIAGDTRNC